jgi:hypothetical protein
MVMAVEKSAGKGLSQKRTSVMKKSERKTEDWKESGRITRKRKWDSDYHSRL